MKKSRERLDNSLLVDVPRLLRIDYLGMCDVTEDDYGAEGIGPEIFLDVRAADLVLIVKEKFVSFRLFSRRNCVSLLADLHGPVRNSCSALEERRWNQAVEHSFASCR